MGRDRVNRASFDFACRAFITGALIDLAQAESRPVSPHDAALAGLIAYLGDAEGLKLDKARRVASVFQSCGPGSLGAYLIDLGRTRWRTAETLQTYFDSRPPSNEEAEYPYFGRAGWAVLGAAMKVIIFLVGLGLIGWFVFSRP